MLPFVLLLALVIHAVFRVFFWIRQTGSAFHYSVPLMMVVVAGLTHAAFEDWLFAVGYYLTVLFWTLAFLLVDLAPAPGGHRSTVFHGLRFRYAANSSPAQQ